MMYTYTFILFEMLATIVVFLISLDNKFKRIYEQLQLNYTALRLQSCVQIKNMIINISYTGCPSD